MSVFRGVTFLLILATLSFSTGCLSVMSNDGAFEQAVENARCLESVEGDTSCVQPTTPKFYLEENEAEPAFELSTDSNTALPRVHSDVI